MTEREAAPLQHVAIVMDGNGRWAKARGLSRSKGHEAGYHALKAIVEHAARCGVPVLSVFAFSTENWLRPQAEVDGLMALFLFAVESETENLIKNNVRLKFIGDRDSLASNVYQKLQEVEAMTANNTGMQFVIALNYGGRWDIIHACKKLCADVEAKKMTSAQVDEARFQQALSTHDLLDPDLLIRTSGEVRISNFFLWQLAYTECYFVKKYWPDFTAADFDEALTYFAARERRYGDATAPREE